MAYAQHASFANNDPYAQIDPYAPPMKEQRPENQYEDEVVILKEKVIIPVEKYPGYNFVGAIIGPSGSILKELCKSTRSKIAVLGKGSMKDKNKEEELRGSDEEEHAHLKEPLHVLIDIKAPRSKAHQRMSEALLEIYKFMVPPEQNNQNQFNQGSFDNGYNGNGFPGGPGFGGPGFGGGYGGGGYGGGGYGGGGGFGGGGYGGGAAPRGRGGPPRGRGGPPRGRGGPPRGRGGPPRGRGGPPRGRGGPRGAERGRSRGRGGSRGGF